MLPGGVPRGAGGAETGGAHPGARGGQPAADGAPAADGSTSGNGGTQAPGEQAPAAGDFGDLKGVCGPGDASGATAQGVTDDAIQVGTIADPGFIGRPGLNQEIFDLSLIHISEPTRPY